MRKVIVVSLLLLLNSIPFICGFLMDLYEKKGAEHGKTDI